MTKVFIGGLQRSGTTLLHDLLQGYKSLKTLKMMPQEGQWHTTLIPRAVDHGGPGEFAFTGGCHLTEADITGGEREQLAADLWEGEEPDSFLEKTPQNLIMSRWWNAIYPGAKFIFILRHPVCVSLATRKWSDNPMPRLMEHWLEAHRQWAADLGHLTRGNYRTIKYEQLVGDPLTVLEKLADFLGLPVIPLTKTIQDHDGKYMTEYIHRRNLLHLHDAYKEMEERLNPEMEQFGYTIRVKD